VQVSDIENAAEGEVPSASTVVEIGFGFSFKPGISTLRASGNVMLAGTQDGFVHVFDRQGTLNQSFQVGETAVSDLLTSAGELKAACCAVRLTLLEHGRISGTVELPEYYVELANCGKGVLAWKSNSLWLVDPSGQVRLTAETDRPILGRGGMPAGFTSSQPS
jgi:hypothetical protein